MSISIEIAHRAGLFQLEVTQSVPAGFTALVGPSGSGKTTTLNVLAGLTRPSRAFVRMGDEVWADTTRGVWVPPHRRRVGYVFQEPRLFPHFSVRQNLLYGRLRQRPRARVIAEDEVIELLNLSSLLQRRPARLSGGEQQRVALGRALLANPQLLLLDEPLASVDQAHRLAILPYLDRFRDAHRIPAIYVTHAWSEVADRADHVIELAAGRVVFSGSAASR
ncbi:MAG TPA: ATP-binding cassette domain-containing protein [Vicinamibacterales bacterium]|nr:ATP-binding cassette domain-containing protein [Vicinamibacterales bacterium]